MHLFHQSVIDQSTFFFLLLKLLQDWIWNLHNLNNTIRKFLPVCPYCFQASVPCHHFHADRIKITEMFTANNTRLQNVTAFPFQILQLWMDFHQSFPAVVIVLSSQITTVALDDLKGLFQHKWSYDSIKKKPTLCTNISLIKCLFIF